MSEVIFERDGNAWVPTEAAQGPWSAALHGGAPAALLAHALEEAAGGRFPLARLSIDLFRAVPKAPLEVSIRALREGRRLAVHEAVLHREGRELARATALHAEERPGLALDESTHPLPPPEDLEERTLAGSIERRSERTMPAVDGLHHRLLVRAVSGIGGGGAGSAWLRLPLALAPGVPLSPTVHLAACSDFANGLAQLRLDTPEGRVGFINADISLHLLRPPESERIGMTARTEACSRGRGIVSAECFDAKGPVGRVLQTVLVMAAG